MEDESNYFVQNESSAQKLSLLFYTADGKLRAR